MQYVAPMELRWTYELIISYQHAMPNGIYCLENAVRHDMSVKKVQSKKCFELRRSGIFKILSIS